MSLTEIGWMTEMFWDDVTELWMILWRHTWCHYDVSNDVMMKSQWWCHYDIFLMMSCWLDDVVIMHHMMMQWWCHEDVQWWCHVVNWWCHADLMMKSCNPAVPGVYEALKLPISLRRESLSGTSTWCWLNTII